MAFARPTLEELVERISAELATRLGIGPLIERGTAAAIARVFAGIAHSLHGHLDYIARQVVPLTAEGDVLEQWASLYGLDRLPATRAAGDVTFSGTNGAVIPLGALLTRANGAKYRTTASGAISGGTATVAVQADDAGVAGNAAAGTTLSLANPIAGVASAVVAAGGLFGGEDRETDLELRTRFRDTIAARPQGGSLQDYRLWALEVPGVTRVFVFAGEDFMGPGTVGVTFAADDEPGGPIPSAPLVAAVQARLTDPTRRDSAPVTAEVTTFAPAAVPVDFEVTLTPDTQAVRDAVTEALADLILRDGAPGGTLLLSRIREAISNAPGESDNVLTDPVADLTFTSGELPTLGTITFL